MMAIAPSTFDFLALLSENNNRDWMLANKSLYENAKADFIQFLDKIYANIAHVDATLVGQTAKNSIFRLNRDVRFSANKAPYKINFAASLNRMGRKGNTAGYFLHIQPNGMSFIGGGLWHPEAPILKKVRQEIDYCWQEFETLTHEKDFVKTYGDFERGNDLSLKREPKGYDKENPAIDYLKLKSFVITHPLSDKVLSDPSIDSVIAHAIQTAKPLMDFLNRAILD